MQSIVEYDTPDVKFCFLLHLCKDCGGKFDTSGDMVLRLLLYRPLPCDLVAF
jgi:hypothetical protein